MVSLILVERPFFLRVTHQTDRDRLPGLTSCPEELDEDKKRRVGSISRRLHKRSGFQVNVRIVRSES